MKYQLDGREVQVDEIAFEHNEGADVVSVSFVDTGVPLTDTEMDELAEIYQAELYEQGLMNAVCAAEYAFEGDR